LQTKEQMYEQLVVEFATRVARLHSDPTRCTLSLEEALGLAMRYPIPVLLAAFTRTGSFVKNKKTTDVSTIHEIVKRIADGVLAESHALGKFLSYQGSEASTSPSPSPIGWTVSAALAQPPREVSEDDVYEVQKIFQELVTAYMLDTQWTLHEDEASALLTRYSVGNLRIVFQDLGEWVSRERSEQLRFHDQEIVVHELFRRTRVSQPTTVGI
jgi:hypothetical protein